MSQAVYPSLPGLAFNIQRSALAPPVHIRTTPSQREFRSRSASVPRYQYTLVYEFLRSASAYAELQQLVGFFNARGGSYDSFLFDDPDDDTATLQVFGTGDGATTQFQLLRSFGGFAEAVYDLNGAASIYKAGVLQASGYSVSLTGQVNFTTAPAAGQVLTWSGAYYRRVRFLRDQLDTTKFMRDLFEAKKVELISVKA